jgi:hypothetical protein
MSTKTKKIEAYVVNPQGFDTEMPSIGVKLHAPYFAYKALNKDKLTFFVMYDPKADDVDRRTMADFFEKLAEDIRNIGVK